MYSGCNSGFNRFRASGDRPFVGREEALDGTDGRELGIGTKGEKGGGGGGGVVERIGAWSDSIC